MAVILLLHAARTTVTVHVFTSAKTEVIQRVVFIWMELLLFFMQNTLRVMVGDVILFKPKL